MEAVAPLAASLRNLRISGIVDLKDETNEEDRDSETIANLTATLLLSNAIALAQVGRSP